MYSVPHVAYATPNPQTHPFGTTQSHFSINPDHPYGSSPQSAPLSQPPPMYAEAMPVATPAYQHHSRYLQVHTYTPNFIYPTDVSRGEGRELKVECTLFPAPPPGSASISSAGGSTLASHPPSPKSSFSTSIPPPAASTIRLCFANLPLATRVARLESNFARSGRSMVSPPGSQELELSCGIPEWDDVLGSSPKLKLGGIEGRVSLFIEVLGGGGPTGERVLERIWYGEFEYFGAEGGQGAPRLKEVNWTNSKFRFSF